MANEKLLIDLWSVNMNEVDTSDCTDVQDILSAVITYLSEQPTVDAVEVVRCKDCKHFIPNENGCELQEHRSPAPFVMEDDFCSNGERRTDGRK